MKILVVCLGNICRSPIAEGLLKHYSNLYKLDWTIASAGTNGYHTGEAPHVFSQKICKQHGIDISNQRSKRFVYADFDLYDHILVMANDVYNEVSKMAKTTNDLQKISYFLDALYPNKNKNVPDPWYGDEAGYAPVFDLINKGSNAFIEQVARPSK